MARLFISHSSTDSSEAVALTGWLREQGWDDVFLDVSPDRGIAAGERWERALNEAASRCEAVLFMISRAWIASRWCRKEYHLARRLNKRLFGILIEAIPVGDLPGEITDTFQMVDLASGQDHRLIRVELPRTHEEVHVTFSQDGLARLRTGLAKAGLDPRFFAWPPAHDPNRAPFRGLKALEAEDAGIFFGREAPIIEGLDTLRGLAEAAAPRLLVVLGASGAGKSSFLRAGLLPRLAREDRTFLTLPVIRPEGGALTGETGLLPSLEAALAARGLAQSRASIRAAIAGGGATLKPLLARLTAEAARSILDGDGAKPPVVTLAIDQAEELFQAGQEGEALLDLVRDLVVSDDPAVIVIVTIRSDAYDALETARPLEGLRQRALALLPMPRGAYQTVIEGPAARLAGTHRPLAIEPRLTQTLLEDIEAGGGSDALPLLAFTLGQLYLDYGGGGALRLADYGEFGGIRGAIEAAVRRALAAADRDGRIPRDADARLLLLRRALIPWLAGIDPETGATRRRVARLSEIPPEAEPLVRLLVDQRLLSVDRVVGQDGERSEITVEPAHEALLRQWGLLRGWLAEDFGALAVLDAVGRATRDWEANARGADWLNHAGTRLAEAEAIAARGDLGAALDPAAREYLRLCRERDDADEQRQREQAARERELVENRLRLADADTRAAEDRARAARRFTRLAVAATVAVALLVAAAGAFAILNHLQGQRTADALASAEAGRWVAKSAAELRDGRPVQAVRSAARAYREQPAEATRSALLTSLLAIPHLLGTTTLADGPAQALVWLDGDTLGIASQVALLRGVPAVAGGAAPASPWPSPRIVDVAAGRSFVRALRPVGPDRIRAVLSDGSVVSWGRDGALRTERAGDDATVIDAAVFDGSGTRAVLAANGEGTSVLACGPHAATPVSCPARRISAAAARSVAATPDGRRVALGDEAGGAFVFDAGGAPLGTAASLGTTATALALSPDGERLFAGLGSGDLVTVRVADGTVAARTRVSDRPVTVLAVSPAGDALAGACGESSVCLWRFGPEGDVEPERAVRLAGEAGGLAALAWSPDGERLATAFTDGTVRTWSKAGATAIGRRLAADPGIDWLRVIASPDGRYVAAGGGGGAVGVWDLDGQARPRAMLAGDGTGEVRGLRRAGDGRIAAVLDDGSLAIWPASGRSAPQLVRWDANANPGLAWIDGDRRVAVALADGRIVLHEVESGADAFLPGIGPGADPWGVTAAPDGTALYVSYVKGDVRRWDLRTMEAATLRSAATAAEAERGGPESLSASPDGRRLALTAEDDSIRVLATDGTSRLALRTESPQTKTVAFSPDGLHLAALGADGRVYVWDRVEGAFERRLSFQPVGDGPDDGSSRWLAWAGSDRLVLARAGGTLQLVPLAEEGWRRRADTLDLQVPTAGR